MSKTQKTQDQKTFVYSTSPLIIQQYSSPCFIIRFPNPTATDIMLRGLPEQTLIDWCKQFCSKTKNFIDVGAHVGMYALSLAPLFNKVFAFECQRETFYQLCGGVALNSAWNVHAYNVALGDECKSETLNIISLDGGGSSLININDAIETQQVELKTLDSFNINDVGFLKLDVEGMEENVLRGAMQTLRRSNWPPFIFETWGDENFKSKRESLFKFILDCLNYHVIPLTNYPHMFLATSKI